MFLEQSQIHQIYIYIEPVDFRKGIYGLGSCIEYEFGDSLQGKNIFVFSNRSRDKMRILYWDDTGFVLWHKVLEKDRFKWPKREAAEIRVSTNELRYLLAGISIDKIKPHKIQSPKAFY